MAKYWNLGPFVEVADAESVAIVRALELAFQIGSKSGSNRPITFYIFVDSQAAILRLQGFGAYAMEASRLVNRLAKAGHTVKIYWCPSHTGIPGNELVDLLAKKGLETALTSPKQVSLAHLRREARKAIKEAWKADWEAEESREAMGLRPRGLGTHYFFFFFFFFFFFSLCLFCLFFFFFFHYSHGAYQAMARPIYGRLPPILRLESTKEI